MGSVYGGGSVIRKGSELYPPYERYWCCDVCGTRYGEDEIPDICEVCGHQRLTRALLV